jgi:hypothetical protein
VALNLVAASSQGVFINRSSQGNVLNNVSAGALCCWLQPNTGVPAGTQGVLGCSVGGTGTSSATSRLNLELLAGGLRLTVRILDGDAGSSVSGANPTSGAWTHCVAQCNFTTRAISIYINGVLNASGIANGSTAGNTSATSSQSSAIGMGLTGAGSFFDGQIDDCRLYERLLSPNEIATMYATRGKDGIWQACRFRFSLNELSPGQTVNARGVGLSSFVGLNTGTPTYGRSYVESRNRPLEAIFRRPDTFGGQGSDL